MAVLESLLEHMPESELRAEMALLLFQKGRLTLAQASRVAEMSRLQFQHLLASRAIPIHYDVEDFHEDLENLRRSALASK